MSHNQESIFDIEKNLQDLASKIDNLAQLSKMNEELSNASLDRFHANIAAFKHFVPDLAKRFENYEANDLKVISAKSGDANVLDPATKIWLYGDNPREECKEQVEKNFTNPIYTNISFQDNDVDNNFIHSFYMDKMYRNFKKSYSDAKLLKRKINHINAAIIFGVGLGYHLEYLTEQCTFEHIYICEPNSDFFFASLLFCDWVSILERINKSGGYISFNIGAEIDSFAAEYLAEMRLKGPFLATNALVFHHYPSLQIAGLINRLSMDFHLVAAGWGFFDDGVISIAHDYHNHLLKIPLLKRGKSTSELIKDTPIFVCGNGPSLDYSIATIKQHIDDAIILSCGSALMPLLKNGIIPDFHIEVERTYGTTDWLKSGIPLDVLAKMNLLTTNIMQCEIFELFKWSGIGIKPGEPGSLISGLMLGDLKFAQELFNCSPIVANTACAFACYLGFKELYFFGVDNGYKSPKYHHSKLSNYYKEGEDKTELTELVRLGEIVAPGNFADTVFTTFIFSTSNEALETLFAANSDMQIYNTADGMRIKGTTPLPIDDVLIRPLLQPKEKIIDFIKDEMFVDYDFDKAAYENLLEIEFFTELCQKLISFVDKNFTSRFDASIALREQFRFLESYNWTDKTHLYRLLDGSLIYAHTVLRISLFTLDDDIETMKLFNENNQLFIAYLKASIEKYKNVLNEIDRQDTNTMSIFKS